MGELWTTIHALADFFLCFSAQRDHSRRLSLEYAVHGLPDSCCKKYQRVRTSLPDSIRLADITRILIDFQPQPVALYDMQPQPRFPGFVCIPHPLLYDPATPLEHSAAFLFPTLFFFLFCASRLLSTSPWLLPLFPGCLACLLICRSLADSRQVHPFRLVQL